MIMYYRWNSLSNTYISKCNNAEECILLGFGRNEDFIHDLNFSLLIAKQYIYYQPLTNENKIDLLSYLSILKNKLQYVKKKITTINLINSNLYLKTCRNTYIDVHFHL